MGVASHGQSRCDVAQFGQDLFIFKITGVKDEVHLIKGGKHLLREPWQVVGDVGVGQHTDA